MVARQGEVYWVDLGEPRGSEPGYRHPFAVVQNDVYNASRIATTLGIALTSNLSRANIPGNVQLRKGEANLPKTSVVNVTQVMALDKSDFRQKIGKLSRARMRQVLDGLRLVTEPRAI